MARLRSEGLTVVVVVGALEVEIDDDEVLELGLDDEVELEVLELLLESELEVLVEEEDDEEETEELVDDEENDGLLVLDVDEEEPELLLDDEDVPVVLEELGELTEELDVCSMHEVVPDSR